MAEMSLLKCETGVNYVKVNITFDTDNELDAEKLRIIFGIGAERTEKKAVIASPTISDNPKFPYIRGKTHDTVLQMLKYLGGSAMIHDMLLITDMSVERIKAALSDLRYRKVVESDGNKRGARYWLKGNDPELASMLKGARVAMFGGAKL